MKIIKYRAWDKNECKWLYPHDLGFCADGHVIAFGGLPLSEDMFFRRYPNIIIESFTNVLDSSGKEVYEGDLLRVFNHECQIQKYDVIYKVIWRCVQFELVVVKLNQWEGFKAPHPEVGNVVFLINILTSKLFEVVGNIHERIHYDDVKMNSTEGV